MYIEDEIKALAKELGVEAKPCGFAFLNTNVAEVLFRGGHGMSTPSVKPVYRAELVLELLKRIKNV